MTWNEPWPPALFHDLSIYSFKRHPLSVWLKGPRSLVIHPFKIIQWPSTASRIKSRLYNKACVAFQDLRPRHLFKWIHTTPSCNLFGHHCEARLPHAPWPLYIYSLCLQYPYSNISMQILIYPLAPSLAHYLMMMKWIPSKDILLPFLRPLNHHVVLYHCIYESTQEIS